MALDNLLAPHQEDNRRPSRVRLWHTHAYCMRKRQVEGTLRQHLGCCCFPALPLLVCARTHADPTVDTHRTHTHTHTHTHIHTQFSLSSLSFSLSSSRTPSAIVAAKSPSRLSFLSLPLPPMLLSLLRNGATVAARRQLLSAACAAHGPRRFATERVCARFLSFSPWSLLLAYFSLVRTHCAFLRANQHTDT